MRLQAVAKKHSLKDRFRLGLFTLVFRRDSPLDVIRTVWHRPEYFGGPFIDLLQTVMRGPSEWSVGERELFAAFTSKLNECPFCLGNHEAVAAVPLGAASTRAILDNWQSAPDPKVRETLGFLEKMTRSPGAMQRSDAEAVRAAGVSEKALEDAIYVAFLFNLINRIANSLDFHVPSARAFGKLAPILLKNGYPK